VALSRAPFLIRGYGFTGTADHLRSRATRVWARRTWPRSGRIAASAMRTASSRWSDVRTTSIPSSARSERDDVAGKLVLRLQPQQMEV